MKFRFSILNIATATTLVAFLFFLQMVVEDTTSYWVGCKKMNHDHEFRIENGIFHSTVYAKRKHSSEYVPQFTVTPLWREKHRIFDELR